MILHVQLTATQQLNTCNNLCPELPCPVWLDRQIPPFLLLLLHFVASSLRTLFPALLDSGLHAHNFYFIEISACSYRHQGTQSGDLSLQAGGLTCRWIGIAEQQARILVHFNMVALDGAIMPTKQAYSCVVLDWLPSPVVLGMLFLVSTYPNHWLVS